MKKNLYLVTSFLIVIFLFGFGTAFGQDNLKENIFSTYKEMIEDLRRQNAEILSPEYFREAVKYFKEASKQYDEKEVSLVKIRENLNKSKEYADKAEETVKLAGVTLAQTLEGREAALNANAPLYATELWRDAEDELRKAALNLEDNDIKDARAYGSKALEYYSSAELRAIKNSILGAAREIITAAREADAGEYCYHTFSGAQNLLLEAESLLAEDRSATEAAREKARQAVYRGKHAKYLATEIRELAKDRSNWEFLFLKFEGILADIGDKFNYNARFDQGFDPAVAAINAHIENLKEEKKRLINENQTLEEELIMLRESQETISAELQKKQLKEKKIESVKSLFNENEALVVYSGENLIIHLYGLNFQAGQAIIQPEYFSLLTRVERALREFPEQYFVIEGHTDATGNALNNKLLSEERARAVKQYLIANMEIEPSQVEHYGLGDQKPIESNRTAEGRRKNRRIDVIISLDL